MYFEVFRLQTCASSDLRQSLKERIKWKRLNTLFIFYPRYDVDVYDKILKIFKNYINYIDEQIEDKLQQISMSSIKQKYLIIID